MTRGLPTRSTQEMAAICFCETARCDGASEWKIANSATLPIPLFASDACLAAAIRRAGVPAIVDLIRRETETVP